MHDRGEGLVFDGEGDGLGDLRKHVEVEQDGCEDAGGEHVHTDCCQEEEELRVGHIVRIATHVA